MTIDTYNSYILKYRIKHGMHMTKMVNKTSKKKKKPSIRLKNCMPYQGYVARLYHVFLTRNQFYYGPMEVILYKNKREQFSTKNSC